MSHQYDAFISHKSERKPWVKVLAKNLQQHGVRVFLDEWNLVPGQSLARQLDDALRASRKGILVATPEIASSGWVGDEYERMLGFKHQNQDFSIIPIRLGRDIAEMPFLSILLSVDFPSRDEYRVSFHRLLCALHDQAPGSTPALDIDLELPDAEWFNSRLQTDRRVGGHDLETEIFDKLQTRRAVLLCAQSDQVSLREKERLFKHGTQTYGRDRVLRFTLPYGPEADLPDFFRLLAQRCQLGDGISDARGFFAPIRRRLESSEKPLLLLIGGFENGIEEGQRLLARHLRSLHEEHPNLYFLIFGGEGLADLYYSPKPGLSPLNIADLLEWPELQPEDARAIYRELKPGADLEDALAVQTLDLVGGHLRLLEYALDFLKSHTGFDAGGCRAALLENPYLAKLFLGLQRLEGFKERLEQVLPKAEFKARLAGTYIGDTFARRLYWQNLLKRHPGGRALAWRCPLLQEAGQQFLELDS